MLLASLGPCKGLYVGDTETGAISYSYPTSPNANAGKRDLDKTAKRIQRVMNVLDVELRMFPVYIPATKCKWENFAKFNDEANAWLPKVFEVLNSYAATS